MTTPVNAKVMATQKQIIDREYPNRRIGDFLKELQLMEDRGTGFPTIYDAMANNSSPDSIIETAHFPTKLTTKLQD